MYFHLIRTVSLLVILGASASAERIITTLVGSTRVFRGDGGPAIEAGVAVASVTVDSLGNIFVADQGNHVVVKITPDGILRVVAGSGIRGFSGDGGPATSASLNEPIDVAVNAAGVLYIADRGNHRVRQVGADGIIRTIAGNGEEDFFGDGGPATLAALNAPTDVALDRAGNLYIADQLNSRIRLVRADGTIRTVAGSRYYTGEIDGEGGDPRDDLGDGGLATAATLLNPTGVAVDANGTLFIADHGNSRVREVSTNGRIETVAGDGIREFFGDGGPATEAGMDPISVAVSSSGDLFIADYLNNRVRHVSRGLIRTVAGNGEPQFGGDGGPATRASLRPTDVTLDSSGNLFIADSLNFSVRRVSSDSVIRTVAGNRTFAFSGDGGPATNAVLYEPAGNRDGRSWQPLHR